MPSIDLRLCAIATDGTVHCWGNSSLPQVSGAPAGTFTRIAAGPTAACAIAADMSLHCWGQPPVSQASAVPAGSFTQVAVGNQDACAIATDDSLHCWGAPGALLQAAPAGTTFTSVATGSLAACAVAESGVVRCWGGSDAAGVGSPPVAPGPAPPLATTGQPYSFAFMGNGTPAATLSVTAGSLPAGLSLSPAGALSGTPTGTGTTAFTVTAASLLGSASRQFTMTTGPDVIPPGVTISMTTHGLVHSHRQSRQQCARLRGPRDRYREASGDLQ